MSRGLWAVALLALLVPIAGCADNAATPPQTVVPDSIQDVEVTDDTGALRGIVLDEKITPLGGVTVAVTGIQEIQTTANDGGFAFSGLAPGDYFLTVEKAGYKSIQSSGTVIAGDANPPLLKVIMAIDNATQPFVELQNWKAFLQCGVSAPAPVPNPVTGGVSTNPCAASGSDNVHDFFFGSGVIPNFAQAEAVWTGTQPLGNSLSMGFFDSGIGNWKSANGQSPLIVPATQQEIIDAKGEDIELLTVRVFPGYSPGTPPMPVLVVNQQYDVYVSYFYNFVPREGYAFAIDGPCDPPQKCA